MLLACAENRRHSGVCPGGVCAVLRLVAIFFIRVPRGSHSGPPASFAPCGTTSGPGDATRRLPLRAGSPRPPDDPTTPARHVGWSPRARPARKRTRTHPLLGGALKRRGATRARGVTDRTRVSAAQRAGAGRGESVCAARPRHRIRAIPPSLSRAHACKRAKGFACLA